MRNVLSASWLILRFNDARATVAVAMCDLWSKAGPTPDPDLQRTVKDFLVAHIGNPQRCQCPCISTCTTRIRQRFRLAGQFRSISRPIRFVAPHWTVGPRGMESQRQLTRLAGGSSLDLTGDGEASRLVPVMHRAGGEANTPLLHDAQQRTFGEDQFHL
jgi:hypothetical protein